MSNPYETPTSAVPRPKWTWKLVCLIGCMAAVSSFLLLPVVVVGMQRLEPASGPRRWLAGAALLLNVLMYLGGLAALGGAMGWAVARRRNKPEPG